MRPTVIVCLVSVAAGALLAQSARPQTPQTFVGRVVDASSGAPLRRVFVSSGDARADPIFTDDRGMFALSAALPAPLTLLASKPGYAAAFVTVAPGREPVTVRLRPGAAVSGRVTDPFGAPFFGGFVIARRLDPETDGARGQRQVFTSLDRLGEFRLSGLAAGRYQMTAVRVPPERSPGAARLESVLFGAPELLDVAGDVIELAISPGDDIRDVAFTMPFSSETCAEGPSFRPAPEAVTGTITGRVTAASGQPLACAIVRLHDESGRTLSSHTDRQGRYSIPGVPAGTFVVDSRKRGYVQLRHGQRHPSDPELPVALREGETRAGIDFVLPRTSTVSGRVIDEHGEPVQGVIVQVGSPRVTGGRLTMMSTVLPSATDDRGQYRLLDVEAGSYLVTAIPMGAVSHDAGEPARGYVPVYYPGTSDLSAAGRVAVGVGRDADGVDIVLTPSRTATVSGWVFDASGRPVTGTAFLAPSGNSAPLFGYRSAAIEPSGRFLIREVPSGQYFVQGHGRPDGGAPQFGTQPVTVSEADPPPIVIVVAGQARVEGRVTIEGAQDSASLGILVTVSPDDDDRAPVPPSEAGRSLLNGGPSSTVADGHFNVVGVTGRSRFVVTTSSCDGCFLRAASVNGIDATDAPFDFGAAGGVYRNVALVISDAGAEISGRAFRNRDEPARLAPVVVFPADRERWYLRSRFVKSTRTVNDGTFRVTGLPPGEYYVAAATGLDVALIGAGCTTPMCSRLCRKGRNG